TILKPNFVICATANGTDLSVDVASDGTDFMVVWTDALTIRATRVTSDGAVTPTCGKPILNGPGTPSIAFGSGNYFVVWSWETDSTTNHMYGARLAPDGTLLDPSGVDLLLAGGQSYPAVASNGTDF